MKLVSIIIPCYNATSTLDRCLCGILAQTYTHWEAWLLNDGSTDDTEALIHQWSQKDSRIQAWRTKTNLGVSAMRNQGVKLAQGEWIAFCDADDEWIPEKLNIQLNALDAAKANLCCSSFWFVNDEQAKYVRTEAHIDRATLMKTNPIPFSTAILEKSLLEGLVFEVLPPPYIHEDFAFWHELFAHKTIQVINLEQALVRLYPSRGSRSSNKWLAARSHAHVLRNKAGVKGLRLAFCMFQYALRALKKRL